MHDPMRVRFFERLRDLDRDIESFVDRDRPPRDPLARDELEHEVVLVPDCSRP